MVAHRYCLLWTHYFSPNGTWNIYYVHTKEFLVNFGYTISSPMGPEIPNMDLCETCLFFTTIYIISQCKLCNWKSCSNIKSLYLKYVSFKVVAMNIHMA